MCCSGFRDASSGQTRWIWLKLSSTGVSRPKISTRALTLWASTLISVIVACRVANGPSTTMTESETSKSATSTCLRGVAVAVPPPAGAAAAASALAWTAGPSMFSTSSRLSGIGWWLWPTKPVTDGVCRTPDQDVAGENGALDDLALPVLDLGYLLGGDHDLVDVVLHVQRGGAVLEVRPDPVLHAVVGVDDVPLARLGPQLTP